VEMNAICICLMTITPPGFHKHKVIPLFQNITSN
jgi:hypothetical protein